MKPCILCNRHDKRRLLAAAVGGIKAPATRVRGDPDTMSFSLHEVPPADAPAASGNPPNNTRLTVGT
jgi:hypothetical protein